MPPKIDPYASKLHKRINAILFVFTVIVIVLLLRASAHGQTFRVAENIRDQWAEDDWWAERAAVFFPRYQFTLVSNNAILQMPGADGQTSQIISPNSAAPDLFWRTDGTSGTWTAANWSNPASATGGTAWTSGDDAFFTANSTVTFATTAVSDVTLSNGIAVAVTAGVTLTLGGVRTFDIGTGSTLTWTNQSQSTAAGNEGAGIIKNGAGTLSLGAIPANVRYDGGFTLNAGTVIVSGQSSFGTGVMTINGGTLQSSGGNTFTSSSLTIGGDFAFAGTGNDIWSQTVNTGSSNRTITNNTTSTATRTFSNIISGTGGLTFAGTGGSGGIVLSGANNYSGGTTVSGGLLKLSGSGTLGSTSGSLTVNGGILDLNGTNQTVGALNGSGGTILNEAPSGGSGPKTLTIGNGDASGTFSGTITDHDGNGSGFVKLVKTGSGTQNMTSITSNYTGGTDINGGALLSNSSNGGALGRGPIVVNNTGTLGGSGTIDSAATITVNSGGTLKPGATAAAGSIAKLNTGSVTLNSSSNFVLDLNAGAGPTGIGAGTIYDQLSVTGTVTLGGGMLTVNPGAGLVVGDKFFIVLNDLMDAVSGTFSGLPTTGSTFTSGGDTFLISYIDNGDAGLALNDISLTVTAVPEPSTWLGGALALGAVVSMQLRRLRALLGAPTIA